MGYRYDISIRSTHKYAVRASGDIARVVDLPDGGVALLVIDGQGSGPSARAAAREVASRLAALLDSGASGEVAALAANQALTSSRFGQVSVSFDIVRAGIDGAIELVRYSTNQVFASDGTVWQPMNGVAGPAGRYATNGPDVHQWAAPEVETIVVATDGVDASLLTESLNRAVGLRNPQDLASTMFDQMLDACSGRPKDDVTLAVLTRQPVPADQRFESIDYARDVR